MVKWRGKKKANSDSANTASSEHSDNRSLVAKLESKLLLRNSYYTFIFIFILQNLLQFWWGAVEEAHHQPNDFHQYTIPIARGAGYMINFNVVLLLLFASRFLITSLRKTPLSVIFPFDKSMPLFHIIIGYVIFVSAAIHGVTHVVPGIISNHWKEGFGDWTFSVITGITIFSISTVMVITARGRIRHKKFELFYHTHIAGAFFFIVLLFLHGNFRTVLYTYKWISAPVFLYLVDRVLRKVNEHHGSVTVSSNSAPGCGGDIYRLSVPKAFDYRPGQYAEVKIPCVAKHEWHPFTIASAPHEEDMVFYIKAAGSWTEKVRELIRSIRNNPDESGEGFRVHVRGPYGAPSQHIRQYRSIVLIAGGVGSTPFCSIAKSVVKYVEDQRKNATESYDSDEEGESQSTELTASTSLETDMKESVGNIGRTVTEHPTEVDVEEQRRLRSSLVKHPKAAFRSIGDQLRFLFNSVTAQTILLWIMLLRLYLIFLAAAMKETRLKNTPGFEVATNGFIAADLALILVAAILLFPSVLLEYTRMNKFTLLDIFVLAPIIVANIVGHILGLANVGRGNVSTEVWPFFYYFFIFPAGFLLYAWRYARLVGEQTIIAPALGYKNQDTKSVDFIWTTRKADDDTWLVKELEKHAYSKYLRLHRFLTREDPDPENGEKCANVGRFYNNYGRPDWDELFETLVMNSKSHSTIGVFFCGPKKMEDAVRKAAINAMVLSTKRAYCSVSNAKNTQRGAHVRFVVRAENF